MTAATVHEVAVTLGRDAPSDGSAESEQWLMWLDDAELQIQSRLGSLDALDQRALSYVVREAVAMKVRNPAAISQQSISVDDASMSKTWQRSTGLVTILDEWWDMLAAGTAKSARKIRVLRMTSTLSPIPDR